MAIERWELKVKNKQNFFGDWQLDITGSRLKVTQLSFLVIRNWLLKLKKWITRWITNHQQKGKNPFLCESPITNHQSPITRNLRAGWKSGGQFQLGHLAHKIWNLSAQNFMEKISILRSSRQTNEKKTNNIGEKSAYIFDWFQRFICPII